MRRKAGAILPLEAAILVAAVELSKGGTQQFHGFLLAKALRELGNERGLTAHGTLYKALARMEKAGLLESVWEDPDVALEAGRPRRRLYSITTAGRAALADVPVAGLSLPRLDPGWST
jgi:DNA-binding PadR family transcriptional regulator